MELQLAFNIVISIAGFLGGFFLTALWSAIKELRQSNLNIYQKIYEVDTFIARHYIPRTEVEAKIDVILKKLDKIEVRLNDLQLK